MNKKQKIAQLFAWGVNLPFGVTEDSVAETWLDETIAKGRPEPKSTAHELNVALLNVWGIAFDADATDAEIENLVVERMKDIHRESLRDRLEELVSEGRLEADQVEQWLCDANLGQSQT